MKRLVRTEKALAEYREWKAGFDARLDKATTDGEVYALDLEFRRMGQSVGEAYGLDTADRNNMDTCREFVRPGPWLDRMVKIARNDEGCDAADAIQRFFREVL